MYVIHINIYINQQSRNKGITILITAESHYWSTCKLKLVLKLGDTIHKVNPQTIYRWESNQDLSVVVLSIASSKKGEGQPVWIILQLHWLVLFKSAIIIIIIISTTYYYYYNKQKQ